MKRKRDNPAMSYPMTRAVVDDRGRALLAGLFADEDFAALHARVTALAGEGRLPSLLPDLLRVEHTISCVEADAPAIPQPVSRLTINPTVQLVPVGWSGIDRLVADSRWQCETSDEGEIVMVWRHPGKREVVVRQATAAELLALKVVSDELCARTVAAEGGVAVGVIDSALAQAAESGLLLKPPSALNRPASWYQELDPAIDPTLLSCQVFSVQWHITQACDLHCKHCYDRSFRGELPLAKGIAILDDIRDFCRARQVHGQVTFSGGNPLLYPHFRELYQAAVDRYLGVAILGNPASRDVIEALCAIAKPLFYQVSLEGLPDHNDFIRGRGHFERVMEFLPILKELGIYSMVMLTLTRDNQEQVLPLAEILRDKVDLFTFNRLAMVGEGAALQGPDREGYRQFLADFAVAAQGNPCLGLKDNLFNLLAWERGGDLFGGCAGHGCGAAFNFVSILADGEVHACRKFPSPIGNIFSETLAAIYDSTRAEGYRLGCNGCRGCRIRPVCGGCLAVVHGLGANPLSDRDPYCWRDTGH